MRLRAFLAALPLLALAACGSASSPSTTASSGPAASGSDAAAVSAAANLGPAVPAATVVAPAVDPAELPTASGKLGEKPKLTFPKNTPPPSLQREILTVGTGPVTKKTDFLVTNYYGTVWGSSKDFDNSYDKKAASTFQIGVGKVVPGWDVGLVGVKVGSRVLLSLPPADGYGSKGGAGGKIKGTDTIVFVVDVVSRVSADQTAQTDAVLQPQAKGVPTVSGALGKEPTVTIPKGLKEPTANSVHIIAKGTGPKVKAGSVLVQLLVTDWTKSQTQSTYPKKAGSAGASGTTGLQQITVDPTGVLKGLVGVPLGSRVLVLIASSTSQSTGQTQPAAIAVVDLVAQA